MAQIRTCDVCGLHDAKELNELPIDLCADCKSAYYAALLKFRENYFDREFRAPVLPQVVKNPFPSYTGSSKCTGML